MLNKIFFHILWLSLFWYYVEQAGDIEKGAKKRILGVGLTAVVLAFFFRFPGWAVWLLVTGIILLYDLFFDGEPFRRQWWRILLPGACLMAGSMFSDRSVFVYNGLVSFLFLALLSGKRQSLRIGNGALTAVSFSMLSFFLWLTGCTERLAMEEDLREGLLWGGVLLELVLFLTVEGTLFFYKRGFEARTEQFRVQLLEHSYGEIKEVYMDMRGWRHDYHNHMQVMKAQLAMGNLEGMEEYLNKLEQELDRVDTLVKSGNLMADAILNSKLTLAGRKKIPVNCKAELPGELAVADVDMCVILGNLLDNAIEACEQIEEGKRFLRIYLTVNKSQFYLSVQNAAREEPDFNEKNYITKKRGNHGLGMKRVKAAVDKYHGYLNLANEPEIFAAEVTLPLSL